MCRKIGKHAFEKIHDERIADGGWIVAEPPGLAALIERHRDIVTNPETDREAAGSLPRIGPRHDLVVNERALLLFGTLLRRAQPFQRRRMEEELVGLRSDDGSVPRPQQE